MILSRRLFLSLFPAPLLRPIFHDLQPRPEIQPYFPNTSYQLVWRNWDLVSASRIARCLNTDERTVITMGRQMHLERTAAAAAIDDRTWLNVLRRNWFFVPRAQIAGMLDLSQEELDKSLDRDAFYRSHLGPQPEYEPINFRPSLLLHDSLDYFDDPAHGVPEEPRFGFEKRLSELVTGFRDPTKANRNRRLVISYPYFCPYADALGDPNFMRYYPLGLLQRMADCGVSAIWVHALLRELVRDPLFDQDYPFRPERRERLQQLIEHCKQAGLGVYLYLDEPRGARDPFFEHHPEMRGAPGRKGDGLWCMCTSSDETRRFLHDGSKKLFTDLPELQGLILITASENPTHCYSLTRHPECIRCSRRRGADVVAEVVGELATGAHEAQPLARVIAWDWSWGIIEDDPQAEIIEALPNDISLLVDFERGSQIERDGIRSEVDEYSLSTPGPSPRAAQHLELARKRGLEVLGKAQIGTTWELGTLPFIPIPGLVAEKIVAFKENGLLGGMFSWTLGGYPSINWEVLDQLITQPNISPGTATARVARAHYGEESSQLVQKSWAIFAEAFRNYPFSNTVVYSSFVQEGPASQLFIHPSGFAPRILNSFDSLAWTQPFGPERTAEIFAEMGNQWRGGIAQFRSAEIMMNASQKQHAQQDLAVMEAAGLYFESIALLIRYYEMRDRSVSYDAELRRNLQEQLRIVERFALLCRIDSRIGFEASVGYMYLPHDVREKVVACRYALAEEPGPRSKRLA